MKMNQRRQNPVQVSTIMDEFWSEEGQNAEKIVPFLGYRVLISAEGGVEVLGAGKT